MLELLKHLTAPPVFPEDEDKTYAAAQLNLILLIIAGLGLLGITVSLVLSTLRGVFDLSGARGIVVFSIASVSLLLLLFRSLLYRGYVRQVALLLVLVLILASALMIYAQHSLANLITVGSLLPIVLATYLLGRRAGITVLVIVSGALFWIYTQEASGALGQPAPVTPFNQWLIFTLMALVVFALDNLFNNSRKKALAELRIKQRELTISNQELQTLMVSTAASAQAARAEAEAAQNALQAKLDEINAIAQIGEAVRGEQEMVRLAQNVLRQLCQLLNAQMGAIFAVEGENLRMVGSYAYSHRKNVSNQYRLGEGLVGQAALEKQPLTLTNVPADYVSLVSGALELAPRQIIALPFQRNGQVIGVIELAALTEFTPGQNSLLEKLIESISIAFSTAQARAQIDALLKQTQQQAQELRVREEELKSINEELQAQAENLRASQDKLRRQQGELQAANAGLEERTATLQEQRTVLDLQNRELTAAQVELQRQAEELTLANKYKSEFLANMSHELRTPLNSLLILSRMFANNEGGNLTPDQVESAQVIYNSGSDLLSLINEILDLSKVEAGQMTFQFAPMLLKDLAQNMRAVFTHVAEEKNLQFEINLASGLPENLETDQQRVEQIVKNLLSNAFKFTKEGTVRLLLEPVDEMIAIRVHDSGIGMTPEQQQRVFEAFQQADGSTSRKYGGTGLGLTISREMATKLGGKIGLESQLGQGSTFTLYLPLQRSAGETSATPSLGTVSLPVSQPERHPAAPASTVSSAPRVVAATDDRAQIQKGDKILLVIEDDPSFAKVLFDYAHKKAFKCLLAGDGESGLKLATLHHPDAILLDLKLPGMSGWEVLDALKGDASLRHLPVHILSASDESLGAYQHGALGFLSKPLSAEGLESVFGKIGDFLAREIKSLLLIEDDPNLRHSVRQLLGGVDVKISEADSGQSALTWLRQARFDCMILDLSLPDMTGFELLNQIHQDESLAKCPIIVYTGQELSEAENTQLLKYAESVIIKGVKSPERLLDETALFLHRVVSEMPAEKRETIRRLHNREAVFGGKQILLVDDDMRNAYALSRLLIERDLKVTIARSGAKALEILETAEVIDLVLMDIMMPEMDGYETMHRVRSQPKFKNLPILALTAKAMKGDLEKCIAAGANDYLSKPIDAERLFSLLRVWLYR